MTREEEITMAADAASQYESPSFFEAFVTGAKWADEHPKQIEIPVEDIEEISKEIISKDWQARQDRLWAMIERNLRAKFIRKACKWLDCYIDNYLFIDAENKAGIKWDNFINDFRKAMKGEEDEDHFIDANKKVDRVIGTADHIKTALDVLNNKGE